MRVGFAFSSLALAAPAAAQIVDVPSSHSVQVVGYGKSSTPPDLALIDYWVAGEGRTPDEATTLLASRQKAVVEGLSALLGPAMSLGSGNVVVIEARSPQCNGPNSYGAQPQLSVGICAVTGYIATMQANVRTRTIAKAGTAIGLASRLGARDARLQGFVLSDDSAAMARATEDAIQDAHRRASAIAAAAGVRLGPLLTARDQNSASGEFVLTPAAAPAPPPPPQVSQAVAIPVSPRPIETRSQVYLTYAILPASAR